MKKKVLVDTKIVLELHWSVGGYARSEEERAQMYERWIKEFQDFLRDHRSQDVVDINVQKEYDEQCSYCWSSWEEDEDGCPLCCQQAIDEWEKAQLKQQGEIT